MSSSPKIVGFLHCNYRYNSVATQIPHDAGLTIPYTNRKSSRTGYAVTPASFNTNSKQYGLNRITIELRQIKIELQRLWTSIYQIPREKLEPEPGSEPRISRSLAWRSILEFDFVIFHKAQIISLFPLNNFIGTASRYEIFLLILKNAL